MQIAQNNSYQSKQTNFKAIPVAQVKVRENITKFTIYEATKEDLLLLKRMSKKLKMQKLMPEEAGEAGFHRWKEIIDEAIEKFQEGSRLLIATHKNRPCGMLSFSKANSFAFINDIASWPVSVNNKVKYTGTALMKTLFEKAESANLSKIMLVPSSQIHKMPIGFYKKFHFKKLEYQDVKTNVIVARRNDYKLASEEIEQNLEYTPFETQQDIALNRILNLDFLPQKSFKERILDFIKP